MVIWEGSVLADPEAEADAEADAEAAAEEVAAAVDASTACEPAAEADAASVEVVSFAVLEHATSANSMHRARTSAKNFFMFSSPY